MKRRTLIKTAALAIAANASSRFAWPQTGAVGEAEAAQLRLIAEAVLPQSLGPEGTQKAVDAFVVWINGYKAGVQMGFGYGGKLHSQTTPPSPALKYPDQILHLEELAKAKGSTLGALSLNDRKALITTVLTEAKVEKIPPRPTGDNVASDMLSHFYGSSEGNDFILNAAVQRSSCRGLATSARRPAPRS